MPDIVLGVLPAHGWPQACPGLRWTLCVAGALQWLLPNPRAGEQTPVWREAPKLFLRHKVVDVAPCRAVHVLAQVELTQRRAQDLT